MASRRFRIVGAGAALLMLLAACSSDSEDEDADGLAGRVEPAPDARRFRAVDEDSQVTGGGGPTQVRLREWARPPSK
jgi:hypothetical protein